MSAYKRLSGKRVLIADAKTAAVARIIAANPGQKVQDYEIMLANQKTFISINEINLILECTPQGQKLVKGGKVAFSYGKGRPPAWTRIKGAAVNQPGPNYSPALFKASFALAAGVETEIASDFESIVELTASTLARPSRTIRARYAALEDIAGVSHMLATRADTNAKHVLRLSDSNDELRERIQLLERLTAQQERLYALTHANHAPSAPTAATPLALPSADPSAKSA